MKVPNAENAIIDPQKLVNYILSTAHPLGRFKAGFFSRLGYSSEEWQQFERHLREQVLTQDVTAVETSRYGQKFIIEGALTGPTGETVQIIAVWVILDGETVPRFVTAYPMRLR